MTTKDQAIARYSQTPKKTLVAQINMDGEEGWMPLFPSPAVGCRTCAWQNPCKLGLDSIPDCTNGYQYEPAPSVVLWKVK